MQVTFSVGLETQQHKAIHALMTHLKFYEENRVATGGYMSEPVLMVTYSGGVEPKYYETKSKELYVECPSGMTGYKTYYSLLIPEGYHTSNFEDFKLCVNQRQVVLEIKSF